MSNIVEKFKKDMKGKEITKQEGNFSFLIFGSCIPGGFRPYINKYYNFDFGSFIYLMQENHGLVFFDLEVYTNIMKNVFNKFLKAESKEDILEYQDFLKIWKEINEHYKNCHPEKLKDISDEELDTLTKEGFKFEAQYLAATVFSEVLGKDLVKEFYNLIEADKNKFEEFFSITSRSATESFMIRTDEKLINFENTEDPYDINWILTDYYIGPKLEEVPEKIDKLIEEKGGIEKIKKELEEQKKEVEKNKEQIEKLKESLSEKEKKLVDFMQLSIYVRDTRKKPMQKVLTTISNTCRETFKRMGLKEEDIVYGHASDFIQDKYKKPEYPEEIEKRKKGISAYIDENGPIFEYGNTKEVNEEIYKLMDESIENINKIKGNTGCKGKARAKAKVILSKNDFHKFKQGEILVTSMTRPEFVPLMKLASAIITDEGGITCHAAIISRELNIPCIIGTKNATRILKDEDLVEVDAEKGVATKC